MAASERELNILIKAKDMASKVLGKYEKEFQQMGMALTGAGAAGAAGIGAAVKVAADFEQSMARVGALSRSTDDELDTLTSTAKKLGSTTSFSASQASEGMSYLAMAGFDVNETVAAMPGLLATAAAGQTDLASTADIVSNVLSGFAIEAENTSRVADVMAATFTSSNTDLNMLGETMKYVAPIATAAGMSLESMAAATGLMGNAGIQGSMAGTSLRGMIMRLQAPTDKAAKAIGKLGLELRDSEGNMKNLPDILAEFEGALSGMGKEQQDAALKTIIGMEAAAGFTALLNEGSGKLREYTGELENAGGTAGEIAGKQLDTLNGAFTILKSGLEGAAISIGEIFLPAIRQVAEFVTGLVEKFNGLDPAIQKQIGLWIALGSGVALLMGGLLLIAPMIPAIMGAFAALLSPIGLVVLAIGALAAAFATNFMGIRDKTVAFVQGLYQLFTQNKEQILTILTQMKEGVLLIFTQVMEGVVSTWNLIFGFIQRLLPILKELIQTIWTSIQEFINENGAQILDNIKAIWSGIMTAVEGAMDLIMMVIEFAWPYIQEVIQFVMDYIVPFVMEMFTKISKFISEIMPPLVKVIKWAFENVILPVIKAVLNFIWPLVKTVFKAIMGIISGAMDFIMGAIKFALNLVTGNWSEAWEGIKQMFSGIWKVITSLLSGFVGVFKDIIVGLIKSVSGLFGDFARSAIGIGKDLLGGIITGVKDKARDLANSVKDAAKKALDGVKNFLGISSPSKLFMEVGRFSGEGMVEGIKNTAKEVTKASEGISAAAYNGAKGTQLDPGVTKFSDNPAGSGSAGGDTTIILQFAEGSIVLPGVENGQEFVEDLRGFSLRQSFKNQ